VSRLDQGAQAFALFQRRIWEAEVIRLPFFRLISEILPQDRIFSTDFMQKK
jgi:hypothetical protein